MRRVLFTKSRLTLAGGLALVVMLSGCGPPMEWVAPPGKTAADIQHDREVCEFESAKAVPLSSSASVVAMAFAQVDIETKCAKAQGYYRRPKSS